MRDRWLQIAERRTRRGEVVSIATDITQLKHRELELSRSSLRFQQLAEASFDGIVVVEDDHITRFNDHVGHIFGWQATELHGKPVDILFCPRHRRRLAAGAGAGGAARPRNAGPAP